MQPSSARWARLGLVLTLAVVAGFFSWEVVRAQGFAPRRPGGGFRGMPSGPQPVIPRPVIPPPQPIPPQPAFPPGFGPGAQPQMPNMPGQPGFGPGAQPQFPNMPGQPGFGPGTQPQMPNMPGQPGFGQGAQPQLPNVPQLPMNPGGMPGLGGSGVWKCLSCNRELGPITAPQPSKCPYCGVIFTEVVYDDGRPSTKIAGAGFEAYKLGVIIALVAGALIAVGVAVGLIVFICKQLSGSGEERRRPRRRKRLTYGDY